VPGSGDVAQGGGLNQRMNLFHRLLTRQGPDSLV
jgi:hypothetical protein